MVRGEALLYASTEKELKTAFAAISAMPAKSREESSVQGSITQAAKSSSAECALPALTFSNYGCECRHMHFNH